MDFSVQVQFLRSPGVFVLGPVLGSSSELVYFLPREQFQVPKNRSLEFVLSKSELFNLSTSLTWHVNVERGTGTGPLGFTISASKVSR